MGWEETEVRVRYADTDQMSVAHHANYLVWFEVGRTEFCRARGFTYKQMEDAGIILMVLDVDVHFRGKAKYDDLLIIRTRIDSIKSRTISFEYQILKKESKKLIVYGKSRHISLNKKGEPRKIPERFLSLSAWFRSLTHCS